MKFQLAIIAYRWYVYLDDIKISTFTDSPKMIHSNTLNSDTKLYMNVVQLLYAYLYFYQLYV